MNNDEQGVLLKGKHLNLPIKRQLLIPLLMLFFLAYAISTATPVAASPDDESAAKIPTPKHRVFTIYSPENKLHARLVKTLEYESDHADVDFDIIKLTPYEEKVEIDNANDIIISIGRENTDSTERTYPDASKLFIYSKPETYKSIPGNKINTAILYMVQPFCRQLGFIRTINKRWKTISIISSHKNNIDETELNKCAGRFNLSLYFVKQEPDGSLSRSIKDALDHSDTLLALPDKAIYNRKTVKNILLTSYRYRKPVIAFSSNFVKSGAIASLHSSPDQIAKSAGDLISNFFKSKHKFTDAINYPQQFDVSINSQVFSALGLPVPDINKLKRDLIYIDSKESGLYK